MSRLEEVNKSLENLDDILFELNKYSLNDEKVTNMELASLVTVLRDISISLAMLVDRMDEREGCDEL